MQYFRYDSQRELEKINTNKEIILNTDSRKNVIRRPQKGPRRKTKKNSSIRVAATYTYTGESNKTRTNLKITT